MSNSDISEGDMAIPAPPGSGDTICPECDGAGRVEGGVCPKCGGSGSIVGGQPAA